MIALKSLNRNFLHQLAQNKGNDSNFRLSKNAVSNETCEIKSREF